MQNDRESEFCEFLGYKRKTAKHSVFKCASWSRLNTVLAIDRVETVSLNADKIGAIEFLSSSVLGRRNSKELQRLNGPPQTICVHVIISPVSSQTATWGPNNKTVASRCRHYLVLFFAIRSFARYWLPTTVTWLEPYEAGASRDRVVSGRRRAATSIGTDSNFGEALQREKTNKKNFKRGVIISSKCVQ